MMTALSETVSKSGKRLVQAITVEREPDWCGTITHLHSLLPVLEGAGVATAAEVEIDGMARRLRKEAVAQNACIMPSPLVCAWAQLPA